MPRARRKVLITSYGLYWDPDHIKWGRAGKLYGIPTGRSQKAAIKNDRLINFREQTGIYVLYNASLDIVYVGQAGSGKANLFRRLKTHRKRDTFGRWTKFSWFGTRVVLKNKVETRRKKPTAIPRNVTLNQIEAVLLAATEPPTNKQGGRFNGARQYDQVRDPELPPTHEDMISELYRISLFEHLD